MDTKRIQEELEKELKNGVHADKELDDALFYAEMDNVMSNIENIRKNRLKKSKEFHVSNSAFSQKSLAQKAGISLSTYHNYLDGTSDNIKVKTLLRIMVALQCDYSDIFMSAEDKDIDYEK